MEKNDMPDIPFYGFEAEMVRYERIIKHLLIALVVSIRQIQNIVYKTQEKLFKHLSKH